MGVILSRLFISSHYTFSGESAASRTTLTNLFETLKDLENDDDVAGLINNNSASSARGGGGGC